MQDLDARGGSVLLRSNEDRTLYLERLSTSARGLLGPALRALAAEVLDQRKTIAGLRDRLDALEQDQR